MSRMKPEAAKPLGAAPNKHGYNSTKAEKIKRLNEMAKKMVPKEHRKAFIKQGIESLERAEVKSQLNSRIEAILSDAKKFMESKGVLAFHIVIKAPVTKKEAAAGMVGWAASRNCKNEDALELLGTLTRSTTNLASRL